MKMNKRLALAQLAAAIMAAEHNSKEYYQSVSRDDRKTEIPVHKPIVRQLSEFTIDRKSVV